MFLPVFPAGGIIAAGGVYKSISRFYMGFRNLGMRDVSGCVLSLVVADYCFMYPVS